VKEQLTRKKKKLAEETAHTEIIAVGPGVVNVVPQTQERLINWPAESGVPFEIGRRGKGLLEGKRKKGVGRRGTNISY